MLDIKISEHKPDVWERLHNFVHDVVELSKIHPAVNEPFNPETEEQNFWDFTNKVDDLMNKHNIKVVDKC